MSKPKRVLPDGPITEEEYHAARDIKYAYEHQERAKEKARYEEMNQTTKSPPGKLPKFVRLGASELRLIGGQYWRDGGRWGVSWNYIDGVLYSWNPYSDHTHLHKVELIEITEEEWRVGNGPYAPADVEGTGGTYGPTKHNRISR